MSYYLAPIANQQQADANGNPLSGGKINTYVAGTSTPATTYTDDTGGTAQTNPIILNSRGLPANPVWLQGGRTYKFVITDANDVVLQTIDDVSGINDPAIASTADQWLVYANAPTYINATSFSVEGDQTPTFQVGRRLRSTNTGGTIYSTILTAAFAAGITTITVANDSGTLDSGLSAVSYGLLSPTNPSSLPIRTATAVAASGTAVDFTGIPSWVKRVTVMFDQISTNGTSPYIVQIGDSGGVEASGYTGSVASAENAAATVALTPTTGFGLIATVGAATTASGVLTIVRIGPLLWAAAGTAGLANGAVVASTGGSKSLSGTLDRIRLTTIGGTDSFDTGNVNILYE